MKTYFPIIQRQNKILSFHNSYASKNQIEKMQTMRHSKKKSFTWNMNSANTGKSRTFHPPESSTHSINKCELMNYRGDVAASIINSAGYCILMDKLCPYHPDESSFAAFANHSLTSISLNYLKLYK